MRERETGCMETGTFFAVDSVVLSDRGVRLLSSAGGGVYGSVHGGFSQGENPVFCLYVYGALATSHSNLKWLRFTVRKNI